MSERGQGVRGDVLGVGAATGSRTWPGVWAGTSGTRPPAYWQEVEDGGDCSGLGQLELRQVGCQEVSAR